MNGTSHLAKMIVVLGWMTYLLSARPVQAQGECTNLDEFLEADVYPEYDVGFDGGDGDLRFLDWWIMREYVVRLREPMNACEMAVADCAPRSKLGNGLITTADFVQAFRYALYWDLPHFASGPTNPVPTVPLPGLGLRSIAISGENIVRGANNELVLSLHSAGDEFAWGFTLEFNPAQLEFINVTPSSTNLYFMMNTNQCSSGRLAILAYQYTYVFSPPATNRLVRVNFHALDWTSTNTTISFSDALAAREVCTTNADPLQVTFQSATFELVTKQPQLQVVGRASWPFDFLFIGEVGGHYLVETSTNLIDWFPILNFTSQTTTNEFFDFSYPLPPQKYYRATMLP